MFTLQVVEHLRNATEETWRKGAAWYPLAQAWCERAALAHGRQQHVAAGIVAALSPRQTWARNLEQAERVLAGEVATVLPDAYRKARAILDGALPLDVLRGPKVRAFYANLTGDLGQVTVDTWALRALGLEPGFIRIAPRHALVVRAYADAAREFEIEPAIAQAIVWVHVRGKAE